MAHPETLCPNCGHGPIKAGAERCQRCRKPFVVLPGGRRERDTGKGQSVDTETTAPTEPSGRISLSTSRGYAAISTQHPMQAAAVLALGAVMWFLRAGKVLNDYGDPQWTLGLVAVDLVAAMLLVASIGPGKLFGLLAAMAELVAAAFLADGDYGAPRHLLYLGHGGVLLAVLWGEPSAARRNIAVALSVLVAGGAAVALFVGDPSGGEVEITHPRYRFRLRVPEGFQVMGREDMAPHLHLPLSSGTARHFGFGNRARRVYGALTLDDDERSQLIGGCQEHLRQLGGTNAPVPLKVPSPRAFETALVFELHTASGAKGRLCCGKLSDGRLAALAVVAQDDNPKVGERAFERIAASLEVR